MKTTIRRLAGFTLIELMVVVALLTVLMAIAIPSYRDYARNAMVSRAAASFVQSAHMARANAMRQSRPTVLTLRNTDQGWTGGWIVFADINNDNAYTAGTDQLLHVQPALSDGVRVTLADNSTGTLEDGYLRFSASGFPRTANNGVTDGSISFVLPGARSVRVFYTQSGRVRRCNIGGPGCAMPDGS